MTPIQSIQIPEACHESWQQMTPVDQGRHCQQCCKTVTDFTAMSNNEIIAYLATTHDVCGRFNEQQLNSINSQLDIQNLSSSNGWKKWVMALSLLSITMFFKAQAQTKPIKTEQRDTTRGRQIPYDDDVRIGKIVPSVNNDKLTVFQDKIQCSRIDSTSIGILGGVVSVRRLSFVERVWLKIKHIF